MMEVGIGEGKEGRNEEMGGGWWEEGRREEEREVDEGRREEEEEWCSRVWTVEEVGGFVEDLRALGTLRLMFSRASRRSAWKSGWRNVHDWEGCVVRGWVCGRVGE